MDYSKNVPAKCNHCKYYIRKDNWSFILGDCSLGYCKKKILSKRKEGEINDSRKCSICDRILARTEVDASGMCGRIKWFKDLSDYGYYLTYDAD